MFDRYFHSYNWIWSEAWQNLQNHIYVQQRLWSACTSAQSDQGSLVSWISFSFLATRRAPNDTDLSLCRAYVRFCRLGHAAAHLISICHWMFLTMPSSSKTSLELRSLIKSTLRDWDYDVDLDQEKPRSWLVEKPLVMWVNLAVRDMETEL